MKQTKWFDAHVRRMKAALPAGWLQTVAAGFKLKRKVVKLKHKPLCWPTNLAMVAEDTPHSFNAVPWLAHNDYQYDYLMTIAKSDEYEVCLSEDYHPKSYTTAGPWQTRLFPTSQDDKVNKHVHNAPHEVKVKSALQAQVKQFYWFQIDNAKISQPRLDKLHSQYDTMAHAVDIHSVMHFMHNPHLSRQQKSTKIKIARDMYNLGERRTRITKKNHVCLYCKKIHKWLIHETTS